MDKQIDNAIRFSLLSLLGVFACVSFILAVASWTQSIALGINLSLVLVGWIMWRYAHGHLVGIIFALLGGDVLLCSSVPWVFHGIEDFMGFRVLINMVASFFVLVGLGIFIWAGTNNRPFSNRQIWIAVSIFCILAAWWVAIPALGNAVIARRQASDIAANNAAAAKAIRLVEDVLKRTGTAPDEDTLRELLSEPVPSVRWQGYSHQIQYRRTGEKTYELSYIDPSMFWGDIVIYDSARAQGGWYRVPF